jgi:hypothetical protein
MNNIIDMPVASQPSRTGSGECRGKFESPVRRGRTEPNMRKSYAVLGAMGIPPGQKEESQ